MDRKADRETVGKKVIKILRKRKLERQREKRQRDEEGEIGRESGDNHKERNR